MHKCRLTKDRLLDLTLDEVAPAEAKQLLEELDECPSCQEEYAALRNILRVSGQALRSALPTEDFWRAHHARLQVRLRDHLSPFEPVRLCLRARVWLRLGKIATSSVRVPVPAALAITVLIGLAFILRSPEPANLTPTASLASVEMRTVQVPVIQERVVTQVVYIEKRGRRYRGTANELDRATLNAGNRVARAGSDPLGKSEMSLVGFRPTDQLKLTISKGSFQDEK